MKNPNSRERKQALKRYIEKNGHPYVRPSNYRASRMSEECNVATFGKTIKRINWLVDSGASDHMTNCKGSFINFKKQDGSIIIADGTSIDIEGKGDIEFLRNSKKFLIKNVLYLPKIKNSLLCVNIVVEAGYSVTLNDKTSYIYLIKMVILNLN